METFCDTRALFQQIAQIEGDGVKTLIENHDAWLHNGTSVAAANVAGRMLRAQLPPAAGKQVAAQRNRLSPLLIRRQAPIASAG
jgi:hypothetical protein